MLNKVWNKLNIRMPKPLSFFGAVSTRYQQYVILLGGRSKGYSYSDDIFIYDSKNDYFVKSDVKLNMA